MNDAEEKKVVTRSKLKLVLKEKEPPQYFAPPHRSTELPGEVPLPETLVLSGKKPEQVVYSSSSDRGVDTEKRVIEPTGKQGQKEICKEGGNEQVNNLRTERDGQLENSREVLERTVADKEEKPIKMDVTISESLANPKTPATPKFLCPPTFEPCSGNAVSFIKNYERTAAANSWDNNLKITYLGTFLEGAADLWFNRYIANPEHQEKTWTNIKDDFLKEFGGSDVRRSLEKKLYETKQRPNQSIRAYYYELQTIFADYDPTFNVDEFRKFFEHGMDRDLYRSYRLVLEEDLDWEKFKKIVKKLEDISIVPVVSEALQALTISEGGKCHHCHHSYTQGNQDNPANGHERERFLPQSRHENNYYRGPNPRNFQGNRNRVPFNAERTFQPRTQSSRGYQRGPQFNDVRNNQGQRRVFSSTRNSDGRPRCFLCNKVGHFVISCPENRRKSPNANGRRN